MSATARARFVGIQAHLAHDLPARDLAHHARRSAVGGDMGAQAAADEQYMASPASPCVMRGWPPRSSTVPFPAQAAQACG